MQKNMSIDQRAAIIFENAIGMPATEALAYVRNQADGDRDLEALVTELLNCHTNDQSEQGNPFILDQPILGEDTYLRTLQPDLENEGAVIGRYKLLNRVGEGGMGVVYKAEQVDHIQRWVALKVIKLGMDTQQVVARFALEQQAMAMFDHPCIARLIDAGATSSGRPYYVMDLVEGENIIEYAQHQKLNVAQRLALFTQVCGAIEHAHQRGIIHRDIKPSNILVAVLDGVPMPKVIDFGIAKALHSPTPHSADLTNHSAMLGTPQYMSPEQAESSGADVDTRTDVYGLGVLLYELLTGTTPLNKSDVDLAPGSLAEKLKSQNIEIPSARIRKLQSSIGQTAVDQASVDQSKARIGSPVRQLPPALDWIVMKSISLDRNQRYQSAGNLANDLRRFLNGDPVEAAPPQFGYRLKMHLFKHKLAYFVGAACATAIVGSSIASITYAIKSDRANRSKTKAIHELKEKNIELLSAQKQIESQNLRVRYAKVLAMARTKSMLSILQSFPAQMLAIQNDNFESRGENEQASSPMFENFQFNPQHPDLETCLTKLKLQELLRDDVQQLLEIEQESKEIEKRAVAQFGDQSKEYEATKSKEFSKLFGEDVTVEYRTSITTAETKPLSNANVAGYFRILNNEFRSEFGQSSPHTIASVNLLAAALIQVEEMNAARSLLEDAIKISQTEEATTTSRRLLTRCK